MLACFMCFKGKCMLSSRTMAPAVYPKSPKLPPISFRILSGSLCWLWFESKWCDAPAQASELLRGCTHMPRYLQLLNHAKLLLPFYLQYSHSLIPHLPQTPTHSSRTSSTTRGGFSDFPQRRVITSSSERLPHSRVQHPSPYIPAHLHSPIRKLISSHMPPSPNMGLWES